MARQKPVYLYAIKSVVGNQPAEWLDYQFLTLDHVVEDLRTHYEKAAIYPDVRIIRADQGTNAAIIFDIRQVECYRGMHRKEACGFAACPELSDHLVHIDVR